MTAPTLAAALDAVPPYVRVVAVRLVEAAGGKEPRIDYPDEETGTGWTMTWSTPAVHVDVEFDPDGAAVWFARDHVTGEHGGNILPSDAVPPSDTLPPLLARLLRSLA